MSENTTTPEAVDLENNTSESPTTNAVEDQPEKLLTNPPTQTYKPVPPISSDLIGGLLALAAAMVILGVIAALVSFSSAPKYAFTKADEALTSAAYTMAVVYLTSGIISAVVFYALSRMCQALLDIWNMQVKSKGK